MIPIMRTIGTHSHSVQAPFFSPKLCYFCVASRETTHRPITLYLHIQIKYIRYKGMDRLTLLHLYNVHVNAKADIINLLKNGTKSACTNS